MSKDIISELLREPQGEGHPPSEQLARTLRAIRTHLNMDVAFVAEFTNGLRVFKHVDKSKPDLPVHVGGADLLEDSYCKRIVDGRLPELIRDAASIPEARALPATRTVPVGAHLSVPLKLSNGDVYGTFCCFSCTPDHSLNERDLAMMRVFAEVSAELIEQDLKASQARKAAEARIASVLATDSLSSVYQPILHVPQERIVGFEALSRFSAAPARSPDTWFDEAGKVGLGIALELKAIRIALQGLRLLPEEMYVSVNVSPQTILEGHLEQALKGYPLPRIVLEVTEHASIHHYAEIEAAVRPLRRQGLRVAVDDAGAGYASFRHILSLAPDIIKLDISLTRNIDADSSRRALARALITFADATNCRIVAEGVETRAELRALRDLGVNKAQGYFISRPVDIGAAARLAEDSMAVGPAESV